MKQLYNLTFLVLILPLLSFSQAKIEEVSGLFYKISIATTLKINKEYTLYKEEDYEDDTGPLINPSALFINNTIGYQFDKRTSVGLNIEYNWHSQQGLHFLPTYLSFQYNIFVDDDDVFVRGGYGSLLGLSKDFKKGNMYKIGLGSRVYNDGYQNSFLIGINFTRKRFGYRTLEGLSSISVFLEFMLF